MNTFNSRDTYLAARREWTANYNALSQQIRETRRSYVEAQHKFSKNESEEARRNVNNFLANRNALSQKATKALSELSAAKEEAHRQWQEARAKL